jgi:hypothetical protein
MVVVAMEAVENTKSALQIARLLYPRFIAEKFSS